MELQCTSQVTDVLSIRNNYMKCNTIYVSLTVRFKDLCNQLQKDFKTNTYRDVIHVLDGDSDIFIFQYGSIVFWNSKFDRQKYFLDYMSNFCEEMIETRFEEELEYDIIEGEKTEFRLQNDTLFLPNTNSEKLKLACSYAIAQSNNLDYFEDSVEKLIKETKYIPKLMMQKGNIEMEPKKISMLIGKILVVRHSVNLHFNLLEKPDFLWEYSDLDSAYNTVARNLEIRSRMEILNKKFEVLQELLSILSEEQKHKYGSKLELTVIWLIVFEIVLSLVSFALQLWH
jgi:uncharacterized Rmd1/YagE family protein